MWVEIRERQAGAASRQAAEAVERKKVAVRDVAPLAFAAVLGAVGEAAAAVRASGRPGSWVAVVAAFVAAFIVFAPLALAGALLGLAWSRASTRALVARVVALTTGNRPDEAGTALVVALSVVAPLAFGVLRLGDWFSAHLSAALAVRASTFVMALALGGAIVVVALAAPRVTEHLATLRARAPALAVIAQPEPAACVVAVLAGIACIFALPFLFSITPATIAFGAVIGATFTWESELRVRVWHVAVAVAAALVLGAFALASLTHIGADAASVVSARAPYASAAVGAVRALFDRDGDGFAPVLLGGDCDDRDAKIHPGAEDLPGDGIDQNCSGADARPYVPFVPPPRERPPSMPARANVVLIQLDAMRPDHASFAGYARPTTPNLDAFAKTATWFSRAYTPSPSTRFAMAALFTGLEGTSVPQQFERGQSYSLLPEAETVAERMSGAGYDRYGLSISYVLQHIDGMGQGFRVWRTPWPVEAWAETYATAAVQTTDAALAYLSTRRGEDGPFFLFSHYQCTHDPYAADPSFSFGTDPVDRYDSAAKSCDREVGRLISAIDRRPDAATTAVIVFSDHGELFGEHGLTSHGNGLFEPDVRALLLVRLPGGARGQVVPEPVSLTDLAPTLLEMAGLSPRPGTDAWSLVPYAIGGARGGTPPSARPIFLFTDLWRGTVHVLAEGVVQERHKLVVDPLTRSEQLYDVVADPGERTDLGPAMPEVRARLSELNAAHAGRGKGIF